MKVSAFKFVKVLLIMLITILGTVLFTLYTLSLYSSLNISTSQIYVIPSYLYVIYFIAGLIGFTALILLLIKLKLGGVIFWMFAVILTLILVEFFSPRQRISVLRRLVGAACFRTSSVIGLAYGLPGGR